VGYVAYGLIAHAVEVSHHTTTTTTTTTVTTSSHDDDDDFVVMRTDVNVVDGDDN